MRLCFLHPSRILWLFSPEQECPNLTVRSLKLRCNSGIQLTRPQISIKMAPSIAPESSNEQCDLAASEKMPGILQSQHNSHGTHTEGHGDFQVTMIPGERDVKLAKDGRTVLIPQPSDDPFDVLNWKTGKKLRVLTSLIFASLVKSASDCWRIKRLGLTLA